MEHTPSGGADTGTAVGAGAGPLGIGAVLHVLREEFPEITVSKIRFLETEGLVEPRRSPSGYRLFSLEDIERLSRVLRMQRDQYLPLKVIREHLDALARGGQPTVPAQAARYGRPGMVEYLDRDSPVAGVGKSELLAAAGVTEAELTEWESYGLLVPDPEGTYDVRGITVAHLLSDLGRSGIHPSRLRAVQSAANQAAEMLNEAVAPLTGEESPQARAEAERSVRQLAALSAQLHAALVQSALRLR